MNDCTTRNTLLDHHIAHLRTSGLRDETIAAAGLYSVTDPAEATQILGWNPGAKVPIPAIAFDYGKGYVRLRPDTPRAGKEGKAVKYEAPKGAQSRIYIPEQVNPAIRTTASLWMLEGEKKALLHNQAGFAAVGAPGVWQFNDAPIYQAEKKLRLHPDLIGIVTPGRKIIILFDRDIDTNEQIVNAAVRAVRLSTEAGAIVFIAYIPYDAKSKGCDDYHGELGSNDQEYQQRLESTVRPVERSRLIGWLVENAQSWSTEQRDHEVRRALMLMASMLSPDEFTAWLAALSRALNIPEARLHALRSMPNENGWAIRAIKPGKPDREYVFDDDSTLPAGIKPLPGGRLASSSGAYLGKCLLYEYRAPVAWHDGRFVIYRDGVFLCLSEDELRARIMSWDGRSLGEDGKLSVSSRTVDDVLSCLRNILRHPSSTFFRQAPNGIAFKNVFVQLVDGKLVRREHSAANRALRRINADLDPDADCPRFDRFLHEVLKPQGEIQDLEERLAAFWQWLGIAIAGLSTQYGKALVAWGPPGTGKSTVLEVIAALFAAEMRTNFSIQAFEDKYNCARLAGKQINLCSELPRERAKAVEMAKAIITGRDDIEARNPYERGFSFRPKAAHVFAANDLPEVNDPSGAFFDRFIVLSMENRFRDTAQDNRNLAQEIIATELGAIGWKALQAALVAIQQNAITVPQSSIEAIDGWKGASDSVCAWFEECCERDHATGISGSEAYRHFRDWCGRNGYAPLGNGEFAASLKAMGVSRRKTKHANIWHMSISESAR